MRSSTYSSSNDINPTEISEYLTNCVSRSIVYILLLSQPLTRGEIEESPVRNSMRTISGRTSKSDRKEKENVQLRTLLNKGVNSGIIFAYRSGGRNYYFLNSDVKVAPHPIVADDVVDENRKNVKMDVAVEHGVGEILGDIVLPPNTKAASSNVLPIPQIDSEKRLLFWLSWLSTPARREILHSIALEGKISRPELRKELGFWADRLVMNDGIPTGIISIDGKDLSFQFSSLETPDQGRKKDKKIRWIESPPSFMLSRSYEPLRCIHGSKPAIEELKNQKLSPMKALEELEHTGRKIIPKNRKKSLSTNFFVFASLFGTYDILPRSPISRAAAPLLLPDNIVRNEGTNPIIWIKETEKPITISKTQFAFEASKIISARKAEAERIAELEILMKRIAHERIQEHFEKLEKSIIENQVRTRSNGLALGKDALSAFAQLEMQREELTNEKKYAEKFFDLVFGSPEQ